MSSRLTEPFEPKPPPMSVALTVGNVSAPSMPAIIVMLFGSVAGSWRICWIRPTGLCCINLSFWEITKSFAPEMNLLRRSAFFKNAAISDTPPPLASTAASANFRNCGACEVLFISRWPSCGSTVTSVPRVSIGWFVRRGQVSVRVITRSASANTESTSPNSSSKSPSTFPFARSQIFVAPGLSAASIEPMAGSSS